jgi:hypothetical protein
MLHRARAVDGRISLGPALREDDTSAGYYEGMKRKQTWLGVFLSDGQKYSARRFSVEINQVS